jgi:hypothetical protein
VRGSSAFDAIDDPADPAWDGHARDATSPRPRAAVALAAAAVVVAVALAIVLVRGRDSEGAERSTSAGPAEQSTSLAELREQAGTIVVPQGGGGAEATAAEAAAAPASPAAGAAQGSGWAPAQATRPAYSPAWVRGDTSGVSSLMTSRLDALARDLGTPIEVISGWRTTHEQSELYQRYLAGTGNLAAVPGTSLHEAGRAADVYVDGVALADVPGAREAALAFGIHFPVGGEPWHAELVGDPQGSGRGR